MTRQELMQHISQTYGTEPEYPWMAYPSYAVFRHSGNRKWFAVAMNISKDKLGLEEKDRIDVLNVKCDPLLITTLWGESGFYRAYHMSKTNWITIALDGTADDEKIKWLLDMSYSLTASRHRRK